MLDGVSSYQHNAVAISEVDLCKIPVSTLRQIESVYTILGHRIREQMQYQLNLADRWIYGLSTGSAAQRVAGLVLLLHDFFANRRGEFYLLHRDDMSAMINIAADNISRIIAQFKRDGLLSLIDSNIYICDKERLETVSLIE